MTGLLASWAPLDSVERAARLRALAALATVFLGEGRAGDLVRALHAAEGDAAWLHDADVALAMLPSIPRRRILSVMPGFCRGDGA